MDKIWHQAHEPVAIFLACSWCFDTHHFMLLVSSLTCSLMASIKQWYSRRSTAPQTHMVKRRLRNLFIDCTTGTITQLGGYLSYCFALLAEYNTSKLSLTTHCQG
ncbi:hypothetical protein TNCV_4728641 [Trichonephila clavipes]|nr:hypothetical protein TNCV_4728641 [Trichonephila clavipes]